MKQPGNWGKLYTSTDQQLGPCPKLSSVAWGHAHHSFSLTEYHSIFFDNSLLHDILFHTVPYISSNSHDTSHRRKQGLEKLESFSRKWQLSNLKIFSFTASEINPDQLVLILFPTQTKKKKDHWWRAPGLALQSVQFSHSVMSNSWWPHGLQHTRLPCPSPTPRAFSNSSPLSWWCQSTISSSVNPFSFCLQSFPASGSFPMSQVLKVLELQFQYQSFQWVFRTDFL